MRYSAYHLPTLKESPAEAELASHQLMIRAGMIRKLAAGLYTILPFGLRSIRKVETIIREEMDKTGALEVFMPSLQPSELWHETGRWLHYGLELLRVQDRHGREFCYGPTHEEVITDLVRGDVKSYKQLPLCFYQIQTKCRDEIRPRFGLMRSREFSMKDAYSFDATDEEANDRYLAMIEAYDHIFTRCGLEFRSVEADSGAIGGDHSREYMVLAESGEDDIAFCSSCNYAANTEKAVVAPPKENFSTEHGTLPPIEEVSTPLIKTIEEVCAFLNVLPEDTIKCLIYETDSDAEKETHQGLVALLIRGDREVNEVKLANALGAQAVALASDETIFKALTLTTGFIGPVGLDIPIYADNELKEKRRYIAGANKSDTHLKNVDLKRDATITAYGDFRSIETSDPCPMCGEKTISLCRGIEVGHVFKLGTKYSEAMNANFLNANGKEETMIMGCYGIGVGRTVAAAIEQNHDEKGIIFPKEIAPFHVHLLTLGKEEEIIKTAEKLYNHLWHEKIEVLWDDRKASVGKKFKDAELLGLPYQLVIGKPFKENQQVELIERKSGKKEFIDYAKVSALLKERLTA